MPIASTEAGLSFFARHGLVQDRRLAGLIVRRRRFNLAHLDDIGRQRSCLSRNLFGSGIFAGCRERERDKVRGRAQATVYVSFFTTIQKS